MTHECLAFCGCRHCVDCPCGAGSDDRSSATRVSSVVRRVSREETTMTDLDWLECQKDLADTWPGKAKFFQHRLWRNSFGHLSKIRFLKAVEAHLQESYSVPTIALIRQHLNTSDHAHAFQWHAGQHVCFTCGTHDPINCQCSRCCCPHDWDDTGPYSHTHRWQRCGLCQGTRVRRDVSRAEGAAR